MLMSSLIDSELALLAIKAYSRNSSRTIVQLDSQADTNSMSFRYP